MNTNLTLDDMILQYSENPFVDKNLFRFPVNPDSNQKRGILNRLLLIASNLFSHKESEEELTTYKRRYSHQ